MPSNKIGIYLRRMFAFDILSNRIDCSDLLQQVSCSQQALFWTARHHTVFGQNHPREKCFNVLNGLRVGILIGPARFERSNFQASARMGSQLTDMFAIDRLDTGMLKLKQRLRTLD